MIEHNHGADRASGERREDHVRGSLARENRGPDSTARFDVHVIYEQKIDVAAECERLKKELEKIEKGIANNKRQLGNEQFLAKAPPNVVEGLARARRGVGGAPRQDKQPS